MWCKFLSLPWLACYIRDLLLSNMHVLDLVHSSFHLHSWRAIHKKLCHGALFRSNEIVFRAKTKQEDIFSQNFVPYTYFANMYVWNFVLEFLTFNMRVKCIFKKRVHMCSGSGHADLPHPSNLSTPFLCHVITEEKMKTGNLGSGQSPPSQTLP